MLILVSLCLLPKGSLAFCFEDAAEKYGINPLLLRSIARIESDMNPGATGRNPDGSMDLGLMQINTSWVGGLGLHSGSLLSDPCYNVMIGAQILRSCIDRHGYTWEAVGCYNAVSKEKRIAYAWKVFSVIDTALMLKGGDNHRSDRESSPKASHPRSALLRGGKSPSLSFCVRDTADPRTE